MTEHVKKIIAFFYSCKELDETEKAMIINMLKYLHERIKIRHKESEIKRLEEELKRLKSEIDDHTKTV